MTQPEGAPLDQPGNAFTGNDRQNLPGLHFFPGGRFLVGNLAAVVKAADLSLRAAGVYRVAMTAAAVTTIEEAWLRQRGWRSCRSLGALLDLERDMALAAMATWARRATVVADITCQSLSDAAFPLHRRAQLAAEMCSGAIAD